MQPRNQSEILNSIDQTFAELTEMMSRPEQNTAPSTIEVRDAVDAPVVETSQPTPAKKKRKAETQEQENAKNSRIEELERQVAALQWQLMIKTKEANQLIQTNITRYEQIKVLAQQNVAYKQALDTGDVQNPYQQAALVGALVQENNDLKMENAVLANQLREKTTKQSTSQLDSPSQVWANFFDPSSPQQRNNETVQNGLNNPNPLR